MSHLKKIIFCWSGGKDSALALNRILKSKQYEVICLLTTVNEHFQRVSMHGVRQELIEKQAEQIGIPLEKVFVSKQSSNEEYESKMKEVLLKYKAQGVNQVVFGDIFLEDLKQWRENNLAKIEMQGVFPIWKIDTQQLIQEFVREGFESYICCINDAYLDKKAVGRKIDSSFIKDLPPHVDPCGENGEYHSFVFAGPIFKTKLDIELGEKVYRPLEAEATHPSNHHTSTAYPHPSTTASHRPKTKGFWFCDLLLKNKN